jgi:hypothetical protein
VIRCAGAGHGTTLPLPQVITTGEFAEAYQVSASLSLIVELASALINQEIEVKISSGDIAAGVAVGTFPDLVDVSTAASILAAPPIL